MKKGARSGQMSIFVILGVVILIILLLIVLASRAPDNTSTRDVSAISVQSFVESCIEKVGTKALQLVGFQGGYAYSSEFPGYMSLGGYNIHYNNLDGVNLLAPIEEIANLQIDTYMMLNLPDCLDMSQFGVPVKEGDLVAFTTIDRDSVMMKITYPLVLDNRVSLDTFSVNFPVRLGLMRDIADVLIESDRSHPGEVDLILLSDFESEDVHIVLTSVQPGQNFYTITDGHSRLDGQQYTFLTANLYEVGA